MEEMGILATDKKQFTLIYNSETSIGKQTLGYVKAVEDKLQLVDISKTKLGDTVWVTIAESLGTPLSGLLSKEHPDAPDVEDSSMDTDDWLKVLQNNPVLLQKPIAINGDKYMQVETPSDVLGFFEVDSAGLEKKNVGESPDTSANTDDEHFTE